jgi:hypothetical protein
MKKRSALNAWIKLGDDFKKMQKAEAGEFKFARPEEQVINSGVMSR